MKRPCARCGTVFDAKRSTAKWCSSSCSANASKDPAGNVGASRPAGGAGLVETKARETLQSVDRLDTFAGSVAVSLAAKLDESSGSAAAAVAKELRTAMDVALEGVVVSRDEMDELQARRASKRHAG